MNDLIAVQKIAGWEKLKTLVLDSVSSPITKRVYNMALDEFLRWFQQRCGSVARTVQARRAAGRINFFQRLEYARLPARCAFLEVNVTIDSVEDPPGPQCLEAAIEAFTKAAKVLIVGVTHTNLLVRQTLRS